MTDFRIENPLAASAYAASVSNIDGTLTISPTTGAVIASLNLAHSNTWTANQLINWTTSGILPALDITVTNTAAAFTGSFVSCMNFLVNDNTNTDSITQSFGFTITNSQTAATAGVYGIYSLIPNATDAISCAVYGQGETGVYGRTLGSHYGVRAQANNASSRALYALQLSTGYSIYASGFSSKNYIQGKLGINTTLPDKQVEINLGTSEAVRLTYDDVNGSATTYSDFTLDSNGVLTLTPVGALAAFTVLSTVNISGNANVDGRIVVGPSSSGNYMTITQDGTGITTFDAIGTNHQFTFDINSSGMGRTYINQDVSGNAAFYLNDAAGSIQATILGDGSMALGVTRFTVSNVGAIVCQGINSTGEQYFTVNNNNYTIHSTLFTEDVFYYNDNLRTFTLAPGAGLLSVGPSTGTAKLNVYTSAVNQLELGYSSGNKCVFTVASAGSTTITLSGTNPTLTLANTLILRTGGTAAGSEPLRFVSGSLLTTATAGTMEFLTDKFYGTITTAAARKELTLNDAALTSGKLPVITTNGRLTNSAGTGYVKVSSGTVSSQATPIPIADGGTNQTSFSAGSVTFASGVMSSVNGTTSQYLRGGTSGAPAFATIPATDLSLTSFTLPVANGGTGFTSGTTGDLLYFSASGTISKLADVAVGSYLRSGGVTTAPLWSTLVLPNAATDGDVFYSNAANTMVTLAKDTNATRYLSNIGTSNRPAWAQINLANGVTGTLPVANGGSGTATAFTLGSVVFAGASGVYSQDNTNFFWDNTNKRLGVGATPSYAFDIATADTTVARFGSTLPMYIIQNFPGIGYNVYFDTAFKYGAGSSANYGAAAGCDLTNGGLVWYTTSATGNANAAATVTERMRLDKDGNLKLTVAGEGFYIKEGSNATMGIVTLSAGSAVVSTTKVTASSRIFLTTQGGTLTNVSDHYISARVNGTSFTITSLNILDASDVAWMIMEPA